jgi:hypothetical protein
MTLILDIVDRLQFLQAQRFKTKTYFRHQM